MEQESRIEKQVLEQGYDGLFSCYRIPGIVRTAAGSLLVYYECRRSNSDWAAIDIGMKKSVDEGEHWSQRSILVPGEGKTVNNPVMFSDQDRLLLLWQEEYFRTFSMYSYDDGETWTEPRELTAFIREKGYYYTAVACGPGHGTVLKSGRYVVPMWMCSNREDPKAHKPSVLTTLYSDDKGMTWAVGEILESELFVNANETALAETEEGEIVLNIRHSNKAHLCRIIARSKTGIDGWQDIHYEDALPDPACCGGMASEGRTVYFSNCRGAYTKRVNLTLAESADGGRSWRDVLLVDPVGGYSDLAVSGDGGTVYLFYEKFTDYLHIQETDPDNALVFARYRI